MPRIARAVVAGVPHHVTQRGNRRGDVFFCDDDRRAYLQWLGEYSALRGVRIAAYCLMTNHVHLVVIPGTDDGLHRMLKPVHLRHAQRINRARGWSGHLWQGRFFSCALDSRYLVAAVRYVERNPVRAGMVGRAEHYSWSSAAAHCGIRADPLLDMAAIDSEGFPSRVQWSRWLAIEDCENDLLLLRQNSTAGLPCGSEEFVSSLELSAGRTLRLGVAGRPKRERHSNAEIG